MKLLAQANPFGTQGLQPPTTAYSAGSQSANGALYNAETFITNGISALTIIAGLFMVFYFVMGGLGWVTAGGDKGKIDKAREQMTQGITGMVVIVISYALIGVIGNFLGLDILHPAASIKLILGL